MGDKMEDEKFSLGTNKLAQFLRKEPSEFTREDIIKFIKENNIKMLNFNHVGLPASCFESAEKLKEQAYIYQEDDVFNKRIVDGLIKQLESFKDNDINEKLKKDKQKAEEYIKILFIGGNCINLQRKGFNTSLIFQDDGIYPLKNKLNEQQLIRIKLNQQGDLNGECGRHL